jgi:hypothetical protein
MTTRFAAVMLCAAAMLNARGLAEAPTTAGQTKSAAPPTSTTLMMRGTIEKYDASTRILSLSSPSGTVQFPVPPTVRIRKGWRRVDTASLAKLAGLRAAVRYTQSDGEKILESVHVFDK